MLVFASICPHPPILIPTIGKENLQQIANTVRALKVLEQELYASQPDVILIISPHAEIMPDVFLINLNSSYEVNFEEFGDWQTKMEFKNCPELVTAIKEKAESRLPLNLTSAGKLDHGAAVPLYYLTNHLKKIPIVPLSYSFLDYSSHLLLGELINEEIAKSKLRVAVIASGDMSHCLTKDAPAPYSPQGQEFDKKFVELLGNKDYQSILKMDSSLIEAAAECGLRSFIILFGILESYNHKVDILSYEGPFGVGYLVANFKLNK
jgi:AmmeMemoRadiSam system protein B